MKFYLFFYNFQHDIRNGTHIDTPGRQLTGRLFDEASNNNELVLLPLDYSRIYTCCFSRRITMIVIVCISPDEYQKNFCCERIDKRKNTKKRAFGFLCKRVTEQIGSRSFRRFV